MTDAVFTLDQTTIQSMVTQAVQDKILTAVEGMINDPAWLAKIERLINQTVTYETVARIGAMDISDIIGSRVDENFEQYMHKFKGVVDQASATQLTITNEDTVVENKLTTRELNVVNGATISNLAVTGSINIDNPAWNSLAKSISEKTIAEITPNWQGQLVEQVAEHISAKGINFKDVKLNDQPIFDGNRLNDSIMESNLRSVGTLKGLRVIGSVELNETLAIGRSRVGVNTDNPEMALSVWDEEVAINIGKFKANQAYIGTSRPQGVSIGVNRTPCIDIDVDGLTTVSRLRVGLNIINHTNDTPGWSGSKGDIAFNSNPTSNKIFAWICLGGVQWQELKSA